MDLVEQFKIDIQKNKNNRIILERLADIQLYDLWLVAGCLFQTVWNIKSDSQPDSKINDYDIFYYDTNLSWEAEDEQIKRAENVFSDLPIKIELRNQARVPLWYKEKRGLDYPPVNSAKDNISRFLFQCNCVGVSVADGQIFVYAPFGLEDIYSGILRPNHTVDSFITENIRKQKADKYISRWPWLKLME